MAKPAFNIHDLRDQAKRRLPRAVFEFLDRGTEDDVQLRANRAALERIKLMPRHLRNVSTRDHSVEIFGRRLPTPMIIAPTGIADLVAHRGEIALAAAAAEAGIPFTLATSSTTSIDEIAKTTTAGLWMQMYIWERRDLSWQVVDRAAAAGAEVLVVTVDMPVWPNREFNQRNGMANPIKPNLTLALNFLTRPRWLLSVVARYMFSGGMPRFANYPSEIGGKVSGPVGRQTNTASLSWDDVDELKRRWPGKLVLKGILNRDDAIKAAQHGVDGIVVSNHGGRTFDAGPAAIDVLPEIIDAVGDKMTVLFDGGVRRGSDVLKAMAIGAKAVLIGRPTLYGLAVDGKAGAAKALSILTTEISASMAMVGLAALGDIDRSYLRHDRATGVAAHTDG